MTVTTTSLRDVDLFADEVLRDPYAIFAAIRETAPAIHLERSDLWAMGRYDSVRIAFFDHGSFSSKKVAFNDAMNEALVGTTLATDPPDHTRLRSALTENLLPRALRKLSTDIDAKADAMVARLVERGSFDAIDDLARAFPLEVVCDLIGVQGRARENMLRWGAAAFNVLGPMNPRTIENFPVAGELFEWALNVKPEDLTDGSVGRGIFEAAARGEIPDESCGQIIHQYVAAGLDTTIASIGHALWLLGEHPDQYELLRANPALVPSAFNEVLRYEPPIHAFGRMAARDVDVDGVTIPAGAQVALLFLAGNRDPRHFSDPEVFLVERNPADNLAFGYGAHRCAGQGLAQLQAHAVLTALVAHVHSFSIGEPVRKLSNSTRGLDTLPVTAIERA